MNIKQLKKKPVQIEGIQLLDTDDSIFWCTTFIQNGVKPSMDGRTADDYWERYLQMCRKHGGIKLKTLESDGETQLASFGDFILKGVKGEFYPCKPDILALTYDDVTSLPSPVKQGVSPSDEEILNFFEYHVRFDNSSSKVEICKYIRSLLSLSPNIEEPTDVRKFNENGLIGYMQMFAKEMSDCEDADDEFQVIVKYEEIFKAVATNETM